MSYTHSFHLTNSAYESIITNNRSLHLNEFGVRMHSMHSYAEFIEMKRAIVRNYAFVRRISEMKRMSVKYSFAESFACIQMLMRNLVYAE